MLRSGLRTWTIAATAALLAGAVDVGAQRARGMARTSVNRSAGVGASFNRNIDVNRGVDVNRNLDVNRNINRDINVDRDVDVDVDHRSGRYCSACCYHTLARATAAPAAAATAAGSRTVAA